MSRKAKLSVAPLSFVRGGWYDGVTKQYRGQRSGYFIPRVFSNTNAFYSYFHSTLIIIIRNDIKGAGYPLRCVVR